MTVLSICRRDATLYSTDTALKFIHKKLEDRNSPLSVILALNLGKRFKQRRLLLSVVMHYLQDSEDFFRQPVDDDTFPKPSGQEITQVIVELLRKLKYKTSTTLPELRRDNQNCTDRSSSNRS